MLSIGDTVIIEENIDQKVIYYKSRIVDLLDQTIHIDIPFNENTGRNSVFARDSEFKVLVITKGSKLYSCNLTYIQPKHMPMPSLEFSKPINSELKPEQRRQFFRVSTTTELIVLPIEDEFKPFKTLSQDISAGGLQSI